MTLKSIQMVCTEIEFGQSFFLQLLTEWKHGKTKWNTNKRLWTLKIKTDRKRYAGIDSNFKAIKAGFGKAQPGLTNYGFTSWKRKPEKIFKKVNFFVPS